MTGVYGHQTRPHNLRHMSIDFEKNIEFLFQNMEDEIEERNRKRAEIRALKSFRDRSNGYMEEAGMRWGNKTHELDTKAFELLKNPDKYKCVYIFGAGLIGNQIMPVFMTYGILKGFIDNNKLKQKKGCRGINVYSLDEYLKIKEGIIVVAVSEKNRPEIIQNLEKYKLKKNKDYFLSNDFFCDIFPIISYFLFNRLYIDLAQISLTERCTLRCKKCAHGCSAIDDSKKRDLTLEEIYKSADSFFCKVDYIREFVLIGGEPLLHQELSTAINYIGERYRHQIGTFSITTNGTITPNVQVLNMCKQYGVLIRISNYIRAIPNLGKSQTRLLEALKENEIEYILDEEDLNWTDYGFDYLDRHASANELINVFDACKTSCREIRENKFYFCVMARSVAENMGLNVGKEDYLDLDTLQGEKGRKELMEFNLGYSSKGYLDMCNFCNGKERVNYPIPVAEQK